MLIHKINLNHLNVFVEVYKTKSMTSAANKLHLTQSGVSQHIKSLEESIDVTLFDRINQKLIPTNLANLLYEQCTKGFESIEVALRSIQSNDSELKGSIPIGMPIEFGTNLIIPKLSEFGKKNPAVKFELFFDYASKLNDMLLNGQIDFAFVDDYDMDKRINTEIVYSEKLFLCSSKKYMEGKNKIDTKSFFESLDYIEYQKDSPVLNMWFDHHLQTKPKITIRASIMDVQGIARFITSDFGAGVLPLHVIKKLEADGKSIYKFEVSNKTLENHISVASVQGKTLSIASERCLDFLRASLSV